MSGLFVEYYLEEARQQQIEYALGGEVWWREEFMFWRPEGYEVVVMLPYRELNEPFDADEFAARLREGWEKHGCRL